MTRNGSTLKGYVVGQEVINVNNTFDLTSNSNFGEAVFWIISKYGNY